MSQVLAIDTGMFDSVIADLSKQVSGFAASVKGKMDKFMAKFEDATKGISISTQVPLGANQVDVTIAVTQLTDKSAACNAQGADRLGFGVQGSLEISGTGSMFTTDGTKCMVVY